MKEKISKLELALSEKTSQYEKDQILWEGKIKFIEEQRDTLKKENSESSKRFESMLDTIQKKNNTEKENIEQNVKLTLANMEQKYQKQVKDIQDGHNKIYTELLANNKELEKEIKALRIENEAIKNKKEDSSDLTKKIEEMKKEKEKYRLIEDNLKEEQDKKLSEVTTKFEKEKEILKKKIAEIEKNLREAEGKRGALLLELEKEKTRWDIEKDNLLSKNSELNDRISTIEKKNENLLRENEKLKNEKNMLRNRGYNKNNETKYLTHIGSSGVRGKLDFGSNYKSAMMKALGELSDDKTESSEVSIKTLSSKNSKNSDKREENKK